MKIELKGLKIAKFASEETICFHASIYADGKKFAEASNDGHGGSTEIYATDKELYKKAEAYCNALPPSISNTLTDPHDPTKMFCHDQDLESIIDDLVFQAENDKEIKRIEKRLVKEDVENTFFRLGDENQLLSYRIVKDKGQRATDFLTNKYGVGYRVVTLAELKEEAKKAVTV